MPLHKHEPVPESDMDHRSPNQSICEAIREIYWATHDPDIKLKCRVITAMAKAMNSKMVELTDDNSWYITEDFWDKRENIK